MMSSVAKMKLKSRFFGSVMALALLAVAAPLLAQEGGSASNTEELKSEIGNVQTNANILWTLIAAALVFWMQAGFAFLESGFTRAKNAAHIMMKNMLDMSFGAMAFWAIGFGVMFGASQGFSGFDHFFLSPDNGTADGQ